MHEVKQRELTTDEAAELQAIEDMIQDEYDAEGTVPVDLVLRRLDLLIDVGPRSDFRAPTTEELCGVVDEK